MPQSTQHHAQLEEAWIKSVSKSDYVTRLDKVIHDYLEARHLMARLINAQKKETA